MVAKDSYSPHRTTQLRHNGIFNEALAFLLARMFAVFRDTAKANVWEKGVGDLNIAVPFVRDLFAYFIRLISFTWLCSSLLLCTMGVGVEG